MDEKGIKERLIQLFEQKRPDNKRYTSYRVGKETGIKRQSLDYYIKGEQIPSYKNATVIAEYFGVSLEWLLDGVGDMYPAEKEIKTNNDMNIPLSVVQMMHEERLRHYEENKILLEEIQKLSQTVQQQMDELKKMHARKDEDAGCADVG